MSPFDKSPGSPGERRSVNSIGFLRVFLAAMVIYTHAYYLGGFGEEPLLRWSRGGLTAGTLAVQCFFVLSGWLVASSWIRLQSWRIFLWHRFLRIAPGFVVCLIVTVCVIGLWIHLTTPGPRPDYFSLEPSPAGYIGHNLLRPRGQITIGDLLVRVPHPGDFNGSLWTLFYEGACYLLVAAGGLATLLQGRGRYVGLALFLAALGIAHPLVRLGVTPTLMGRLFDTPGKLMCWHFAAGVVCSIFPRVKYCLETHAWSALLGLVIIVAGWMLGFGDLVSPFAVPAGLFWLARNLPVYEWEKKVRGDYSYGLYVYGYPVQQLLAHFGLHRWGVGPFILLGLALSLGFAWISWHVVEGPVLRLKNAFSPGARLAPA